MNGPDSGFADLGLDAALVAAVAMLGYEEPTRIQTAAIPALLGGRDLLGLAATGTGKTAAFALPMIQRLAERGDDPGPLALILVPTRELANQVAEAVYRYGRAKEVRVLPVYGGAPMDRQLRGLARGVDVVVATPGRALDHIKRGTLRLAAARYVVLDEADEMLDMGFQEDIEAILAETPTERQMALFSATFPRRLREIAERALRDPVRVEVARERTAAGEVPRVRQVAYIVRRSDKQAALTRILDMEPVQAALLFCRTRIEVDQLAEALDSHGFRAQPLHGGLSQPQRDRAIERLKSGQVDIIVATDVAARGLDIGNLSHVINFDAPSAPEQYVHRIGRTGRAGREGVAITLLEPREWQFGRGVERLTGQPLEVGRVPSAADLRAKRLDIVRERVREALAEPGLGPFRAVCDSLADEHEMLDIAAAAMKAVLQSSWTQDEREIESFPAEPSPAERRARKQQRPRAGGPPVDGRWTRLFIGLGRKARLRPSDLFGAIINETGLPKRVIGNIEIAFNVSFVEVATESADQIMEALRRTQLRGRKVVVRRDRGERAERAQHRGGPRR